MKSRGGVLGKAEGMGCKCDLLFEESIKAYICTHCILIVITCLEH